MTIRRIICRTVKTLGGQYKIGTLPAIFFLIRWDDRELESTFLRFIYHSNGKRSSLDPKFLLCKNSLKHTYSGYNLINYQNNVTVRQLRRTLWFLKQI